MVMEKEYSILGNPNLGEVRVFFLGVENRVRDNACFEVWFNELRLEWIRRKRRMGRIRKSRY